MSTDANESQALTKLVDSPNNLCFACGPGNLNGLHMHFTCEEDIVRGSFHADAWQQGWELVIHGGILATVLDEAMAYVLYYAGFQAVTARFEVRYRRPAQAGDDLMVEARMVKDGRKVSDVEAVLLRGSEVLAEASGRFMKLGRIRLEIAQDG